MSAELIEAINNGWVSTVQQLIDQGVNVNSESGQCRQIPLHLASIVGNVDIVCMLLKAGADIKKRESLFGDTALHAAASYNHVDVLKVLLDAGASKEDTNDRGMTARSVAIAEWHTEAVNFLYLYIYNESRSTIEVLYD